jgi:hypothetical protein
MTELTVVVYFPYRGYFHWGSAAAEVLRVNERYSQWSAEKQAGVESALTAEGDLSQVVLKHYATALSIVKSLTYEENGVTCRLSEKDETAIMDALFMPGTRGRVGYLSYLDANNPELGFLEDPTLTQELLVPFGSEAEVRELVRERVGVDVFRFEVVGLGTNIP